MLDQSWSFRSRSSLPSRSLLLAVGSSLIQGSCRQLSPSGFCKVGVDTGIVHMSFGSWIPYSCSAGGCLCSAEPPPSPAMLACCCYIREWMCLLQLWFGSSSLDTSGLYWLLQDSAANRADEIFVNTPCKQVTSYLMCHPGNTGSSKWWGHAPFYRASTPRHLRSVPLRRCSKYPILLVIPWLSLAS